jgi:hypothetical protein
MKLDEANDDGSPGRSLPRVWVTLNKTEAADLLERLSIWQREDAAGEYDDGWHTHLTASDGPELTVEIFNEGP